MKDIIYENSRLKDLYKHLESNGFSVYFPGIKVGECKSPYIVIANAGSSRHASFSTNVDVYSIMCYVPKMRYGDLEPMILHVEKVMKELEPLFFPYGIKTPSFYDDAIKGHMINIEYKNYKKI